MPLAVELPRKSSFSFSQKVELYFCVRERDIFPWVLLVWVIWEKTFQIVVIGNKNKRNVEISVVLILCNTWWRKPNIGPDGLDWRFEYFAPRSVAYVLSTRELNFGVCFGEHNFCQHNFKGLKSFCGYFLSYTLEILIHCIII